MTISIQLSNEVKTGRQNLINITSGSQSFYIPQTILEHIDDLENLYLAEHELTDIYSGVPTAAQLSGRQHERQNWLD
jgi:RHH-type transcriptional regulator, rel operon repressor / antitoxin RelB